MKFAEMLFIGSLLFSCLLHCSLTIYVSNQAVPAPIGTVGSLMNRTIQTTIDDKDANSIISCSCAVFLTGQFVRGSSKPPVGYPPITSDVEEQLPCNPIGANKCKSKCIDNLVKYLGKGAEVICVSMDRDPFKERAHLFIKHCNGDWTNANLAAGKEYCCKNGEPYPCPI